MQYIQGKARDFRHRLYFWKLKKSYLSHTSQITEDANFYCDLGQSYVDVLNFPLLETFEGGQLYPMDNECFRFYKKYATKEPKRHYQRENIVAFTREMCPLVDKNDYVEYKKPCYEPTQELEKSKINSAIFSYNMMEKHLVPINANACAQRDAKIILPKKARSTKYTHSQSTTPQIKPLQKIDDGLLGNFHENISSENKISSPPIEIISSSQKISPLSTRCTPVCVTSTSLHSEVNLNPISSFKRSQSPSPYGSDILHRGSLRRESTTSLPQKASKVRDIIAKFNAYASKENDIKTITVPSSQAPWNRVVSEISLAAAKLSFVQSQSSAGRSSNNFTSKEKTFTPESSIHSEWHKREIDRTSIHEGNDFPLIDLDSFRF